MMLKIIFVILVVGYGKSQSVHNVNSAIESLSYFVGDVDIPHNVTEEMKMKLIIQGLESNFMAIKDKLSSACKTTLLKKFQPALVYIMKKDYKGLIGWLVKTKNVYCKFQYHPVYPCYSYIIFLFVVKIPIRISILACGKHRKNIYCFHFFADPDSWGKPPSNIFWGNLKWNGAFAMCNSIPGAHYCLADMYILGNYVSIIIYY